MFKKLLSNLPFNPSLITEVSFYAKRLNKESSIRRIGFVFVALTLVVQIFAVISPAEASNQCSSNDILRCGFKSKSEAVQRCNNNTQGFRTIIENYGINCTTLANSGVQTISSRAYSNQLYSMGRNPYQKPGEYPVNIQGAGKFYLRPLSSWGNTSYKMLTMKTPNGMPIMVMYDCGNIVIQNGYQAPAPKPEPLPNVRVAKVNEPTGSVKPGDVIKYTIAFSNSGGTAAFFSVNDQLDPELEYIDSNSNGWPSEQDNQYFKWHNNTPMGTFGNTDVFGTPGFITINARVKSTAKSGSSVCNSAWLGYITADKAMHATEKSTVCNKVLIECPPGTIAEPDGNCKTPPPVKTENKKPILAIEKKAKNITKNISDANGTTASAGDIIEYSLTTKNYGDGEAKDTVLKQEELADILEYADLDFNSLNGAVFDQDTQTLAWNKPITIKPDQSITKTFKIKIKSPVPQTPTPSGNPGSFDLVLTNVYGNTIQIKLPGGITKQTEKTTQTLPNTGPGEALIIGGLLTTFIGYFFARTRLMAKELELVKQEYSSGG